MKSEYIDDQTRFANEEPLFQPVSSSYLDEAAVAASLKGKLKANAKLLILAGIAFVLILSGVIWLASKNRNLPAIINPEDETQASPSPQLDSTELGRRLQELELELKGADPAQDLYPFPAIDEQLTIEE